MDATVREYIMNSKIDRCAAHISLVPYIISACCVLHNFCENHGKQFIDEPQGHEEPGGWKADDENQENLRR